MSLLRVSFKMLRATVLVLLLVSCSPKKVYQEPIATFHGKVIFDPDPLCRVKKGKRSEEMLEDLLRRRVWLGEVKVPYKHTPKSLTSIKCEYYSGHLGE